VLDISTHHLYVAGLTIMLDAYIDRVASAAGTGLTADAITECDWVVVGHSHFDHLWGAERILANTNAKLIATYESVRLMAEAGVPEDRMICVGGGKSASRSLPSPGTGGLQRLLLDSSCDTCLMKLG
jgi:L-ascorbate metabolism protein UlaG (beta-lactamase superfamily)